LLNNYSHSAVERAIPGPWPLVRTARPLAPRELVATAMRGDAGALARLVEVQRRRVVALARFFTGNGPDAEDLAQDILMTLVQRLPTLSSADSFDVWLYRLSRNRCIDHFRRRKAEAPWPATGGDRLGPLWVTPERRPDELVDRAQAVTRLRHALSTLPPAWRRAVVLRDLEELSYEQVAARLDVPLGTAKSQVSRGRARLAQAFVAH
jgi:RNA polymerase sigma-70 factor, ECF subfamily